MKILNHKLLYLGLSMALCLSGCGSKTDPKNPSSAQSTETTTTVESTAAESTAADPSSTNNSNNAVSGLLFHSTSEVTLDSLISASSPEEICKSHPVFRINYSYSGTGDEEFDKTVNTVIFAKRSDSIFEVSESVVYEDGYTNKLFITTDPEAPYAYSVDGSSTRKEEVTDDVIEATFRESLFELERKGCELVGVTETDGLYLVELRISDTNTISIELDPANGLLLSSTETYRETTESEPLIVTYLFDYSDTIEIDYSAKLEVLETEANGAAGSNQAVVINTTTIYGAPVTNADFQDAKLILLNYWEPWCGPCVGEMPDLQALYEKYNDQGLVVAGIYTSFTMDDDAKALLEEKNITYPILRCTDELNQLSQDYVPASYFIKPDGTLLSSEPIAGSQSYEQWEALIQQYLAQ